MKYNRKKARKKKQMTGVAIMHVVDTCGAFEHKSVLIKLIQT